MIERLVDEYTPGDALEDLGPAELGDPGVRRVPAVYRKTEVGTMAPEKVDGEKLKDGLDEDAMNAYDEREQLLGEELMRYLEH